MGSSTPTPWARGNPSMRQVVKAQTRDSAQQRREVVKVTNPNVFSSDGGDLIIPGRREMPGNAGKVLTVNADEDAYELAAIPSGGGGGGTATGIARATDFRTDGTGRYSFFDYNLYPDEGSDLGLTLGGSGMWFEIPTAGIYLMSARIYLSFTTVPAPAATLLRFHINSIHAYNNMTRPITCPPSGEYMETHTLGPIIVPAGSEYYGRFGLAVENDGSGLPAVSLGDWGCDFYVARVS